MKRWSRYPFFRIAFFLIFGILLAHTFETTIRFDYVTICCLLIFGVLVVLKKGSTRILSIIQSISLVCAGCWLWNIHAWKYTPPSNHPSEKVWLTGQVNDVLSSHSFVMSIDAYKTGQIWIPIHRKIIIRGYSKQVLPGTEVLCYTKINKVSPTPNRGSFDYGKWLLFKEITLQGYAQTMIVSDSSSWKYTISSIRYHLAHRIETLMVDKEATGVLQALILGIRTNLDTSVKSNYQRSGAMHILAVSGLHVGILFLFFQFFLKTSHMPKFFQTILVLFILWFYALLAGFGPSVLRATIMFSLWQVGKQWARQVHGLNLIGISILIQVFFQPSLLFDAGFQLSHAAMVGLVWLGPWITRAFEPTTSMAHWFWQLFATSIAVQITTLPFLIYHFHQIPLLSSMVNWVAIPVAFVLLMGGVVMLSLDFIFTPAAKCIAYLIQGIITLFNKMLHYISSFEWSVIQELYPSLPTLSLLSIAAWLTVWMFQSRKAYTLVYIVLIVCILAASNIYMLTPTPY